jgi:hypothetical protein
VQYDRAPGLAEDFRSKPPRFSTCAIVKEPVEEKKKVTLWGSEKNLYNTIQWIDVRINLSKPMEHTTPRMYPTSLGDSDV